MVHYYDSSLKNASNGGPKLLYAGKEMIRCKSEELTRMKRKTTNKTRIISAVYEGKTHEDLHTCLFACFLSQEEPKKVIQALKDLCWIDTMQEELLQFKLQQRNKKDEIGIMIRNKARLVAQGYTQEEGIDYDEVFTQVTRIETIRLFLAYASFKDFVVYQMHVKSAFLYGKIKEEVYVCQPLGFEDPEFPDRVYRIEKALYGLHQAPRACFSSTCLKKQMLISLGKLHPETSAASLASCSVPFKSCSTHPKKT
ncbi:putative ribonuclease H-like domain-containing protein [Tanacetum coccineum]|uniref:Ribonuclease H-like domain-containing protein n=1 Tax=Tanacetum coccineum TaxID=301880 RepID=A0ABQ5ALN5_9ASTR